jgi:L-arabonate dehydrase
VPARSLLIDVSPEEFEKRKQTWKPRHKEYSRGYVHFYQKHVEQAHLGTDMDFLKGGSGSEVTRDSH